MAGGSRVSTSGGSRVPIGGSRVSFTGGVRRMIQNIKEITGNESDDEVYAMLKECGMDPNETTQKLLLQDTFHEVKRKRDKRKESYREPVDSRWRTAMPGRGGRGGRGNFYSRHSSNDAGGGRNASAVKENTINQVTDKRNASSSPTAPELETTHSISLSRSEDELSIGPAKVDHSISPHSCTTQVSGSSDIVSAEETSVSETKRAGPTPLFSVDIKDGSSGIKHDLANQRIDVEATNTKAETSVNKITSQTVPSSSGSRPSSNYGNRPPPTGAQKGAGPSKEWKPKSVHINPQLTGIHASDVVPITTEALDIPLPSSSSMASEATTSKLEKMVDLQLSETQYVIIPHHLQVLDYERHGLTFGSFGPTSEGRSTSASELSQDVEENVEELSLSIDNDSPTAQKEDSPGHFQIPTQILENQTSSEANTPSGVSPMPEFDQSGNDSSLGPEGPHQSVVNTAPSYPALELLPQIPENSESQLREVARIPSFVVQPSLHPSACFYNQIYSPSIGTNDRFSPYLALGGATKYNGNITVLPSQTGQSPQEAPGVMQSSLPQQPVPVFRQPGGVHLSHYPNFIPYSQYISPFYVPPPTLHHFVSNAAFPSQPPASNIHPPPAAVTAVAPVKFPVSQYKPGTNTGNSNHVGLAIGYGAYNSNPAGYNINSAAISTGNDDHTAQFKENNAYITAQQSEGSAFWVPGRDIPGLQFNSFYNPPHPQGPHMTFRPAPPAHGSIAGIYHPSQAMAGAVEVVGPTAGVYQQPHRAQINWANNYRGME